MSKVHHQKAFIQAKIINCLRGAEGGWRTAKEIMEYAYGSSGFPTEQTIAVLAFRLRERGFPIVGHHSRGYRYAPELWKPLDDQAA